MYRVFGWVCSVALWTVRSPVERAMKSVAFSDGFQIFLSFFIPTWGKMHPFWGFLFQARCLCHPVNPSKMWRIWLTLSQVTQCWGQANTNTHTHWILNSPYFLVLCFIPLFQRTHRFAFFFRAGNEKTGGTFHLHPPGFHHPPGHTKGVIQGGRMNCCSRGERSYRYKHHEF